MLRLRSWEPADVDVLEALLDPDADPLWVAQGHSPHGPDRRGGAVAHHGGRSAVGQVYPDWYSCVIDVHPHWRRRGVGSALLAAVRSARPHMLPLVGKLHPEDELVMEHEPIGMNEAVEARVRRGLDLALTVATRAVESAAHIVAQRASEAATESNYSVRGLQDRLGGDRAVARASVAGVDSEQWWAQAMPEQIATAWQAEQTRHELDPELAEAGERITTQVRDRQGVETIDPRDGTGGLREALAERGAAPERLQVEQQTGRRGAQRGEVLEAAASMGEANAADATRRPTAPTVEVAPQRELVYDSAARRADLATRPTTTVGPEAAEAWVLAVTSQGAPAAGAVSAAPAPATHLGRGVRGARGVERVKPSSR